jgi:hypothetical protein
MNALIVLIHIPKTGGTSLRVAAERYFGAGAMLYDYGTEARLTSDLVREWVYEREDLAGFATAAAEQRFRFLSGHFPLDKYVETFPDAHFVSWIRQPAARIWSAYRHFVRDNGYQGTFREFYSMGRFQNQQSRLLQRHRHRLEFVGITERFAPSLARFNRQFGVRLRQHAANRSPGDDLHEPSTLDLQELEMLNADDIKLYRSFERLLLDPV